jgi:septum formation protein
VRRRIVLASASPRRQELLRLVLPDFDVDPADIDEDETHSADDSGGGAVAVARSKALVVAARNPGAVIIGCDTQVVVDGCVLGKPRDEAEAVGMILRLGGRSHEVATGLAVAVTDQSGRVERELSATERTEVRFRPVSPALAAAYVARGESLDKAGAYGIQGWGAFLVEGISGCYSNVVGLPLFRLSRLLAEVGVDLLCG